MRRSLPLLGLVSAAFCIFELTRAKECSQGIRRQELTELYSYLNTYIDHFSTTWTTNDHQDALSDYAQVDVYGLVANRSSASNDPRHRCECLQELIQLFDEQYGIGGIAKRPGLFGRIDHKLIRKGHPFNNGPFEKYAMTGETVYCVPNYGDCGASVPLYEWFIASEVDTLLTTRKRFASNDDSNVVSMGVLCYIWPLDYLSGDQAPPRRQSDEAELTNSVPHPAVQLLSPEAKEALGKTISLGDLECDAITVRDGKWTYTELRRVPGSLAFLNCNSGFMVNGSSTSVCQRTKQWMPEPGRCQVGGCASLGSSATNGGRVVYSAEVLKDPITSSVLDLYAIGTTAMLICPERTDVSHKEPDIVYCTESGWFPAMLGRCERVCPLLIVPRARVVYSDQHGMDQMTNTEGTVATVICDSGTKLVGPGSAVCSTGEWSVEDVGQCKPLACPRLREIPNGKLEYVNAKSETLNPQIGVISPGTTARLRCLGKGKLVGARESLCNASEKWDPPIGTCK